jgi:3-hydroxy-9,10-secoandrosta-1,3,5(10)-triene-9,17-dione monooxygenase reductase component
MAHLPTGVSVVTAPAAAGPLGATANAVTSLSLEPPLVLACLDLESRTLAAARAAGRFGVSVLGAEQEGVARAFATKAPHAEKWGDVAWSERGGVPVVREVPLWIACELEAGHPAGDHEILIGSVTELGGEGGDPLVFWAGGYRGL